MGGRGVVVRSGLAYLVCYFVHHADSTFDFIFGFHFGSHRPSLTFIVLFITITIVGAAVVRLAIVYLSWNSGSPK